MATDQVFLLPDLGEGLTEAEVLVWKVSVGDRVTVDQHVVEVETAKAAVEVPCPYAGEVTALHAEAGTLLEVGKPLITIAAESSSTPEPRSSQHGQHREEEKAGSGNVLIGYGTGHGGPRRRRARVGSAPTAQPVPTQGTDSASYPAATTAPATAGQPRVLSPVVRKLARHHDVDLATVRASGPGGVIVRADVERAIAEATSVRSATASTPGETRTPLRGMRGAVAEKLSRSRREIPDATTWVDLDATALLEARTAMREAGADVGLLALFARICVAGLRRFPELNSTVDVERNEIVRYGHVNLGFAAQTDRGLLVPVIRDAHDMTTEQLAVAIRELTDLARSGALAPEQLSGGTFTLNNYGVFGVDGSTPIINHPEAALLGIGRIVDKPWAHRGELALRKVTQASLSFDHRVCDGGVAGGFLRYVGDCIENPITLLSGL
ncbi:2-oxo acid dehydrogenase subunit E2 [Allosaccharopolyspora coralli]|uniref:Dihydrolipoamide acetyltransferase component of pyruvate dehydrogenase complex n=1 Tax=Allosaccharopolyspora coralli TaxID=2665642 RepID=A0A5Q3QCY0_9PSEU|nr:2-oxo acid dehydrogenase subunit E2 [Allosaccharopolyspora coralli]